LPNKSGDCPNIRLRDGGLTVPEIAQPMSVGERPVFNYLARLFDSAC